MKWEILIDAEWRSLEAQDRSRWRSWVWFGQELEAVAVWEEAIAVVSSLEVQAPMGVDPKRIDLDDDDDEIEQVRVLKGEPLDPLKAVVMRVVKYCSVTGLKVTV